MTLRRNRRASRRIAFTLTEMLVVVAIIVVLAGMAVNISFSVYEDAQRNTAGSVIRGTLVPAVTRYKLNNEEHQLPGSLQDLVTGAGLPADQLNDPWGHPYQYSQQSSHGSTDGFDIWSDCNGGKPIGNWKD